jgi:hypothetical protein
MGSGAQRGDWAPAPEARTLAMTESTDEAPIHRIAALDLTQAWQRVRQLSSDE